MSNNQRMTILRKMKDLLDNTVVPPKYLEHMYSFLAASDVNEAIMLIRKLQISEENYYKELEQFNEKVFLSEEDYEYLKDLYKKYKSFFNKKEEKEADLSFYLNIANTIISSDCSIEEYCSKTGKYRIVELRKIISKIKLDYSDVYDKLESLCKKRNKRFYSYIKLMMIDIKTNENFDIVDYYYLTKLHPSDFLLVCRDIIPSMNTESMLRVKILMSKFSKNTEIKINKEQELNGTTIIDGREITREEKETVFQFLENENMPNLVYKQALKRYINNDEKILEYMGIKKVK